jgi:hypothetical protein
MSDYLSVCLFVCLLISSLSYFLLQQKNIFYSIFSSQHSGEEEQAAGQCNQGAGEKSQKFETKISAQNRS